MNEIEKNKFEEVDVQKFINKVRVEFWLQPKNKISSNLNFDDIRKEIAHVIRNEMEEILYELI